MQLNRKTVLLSILAVSGTCATAHAAVVLRTGAGADAAAIQSIVDAFRADVGLGGGNNGNGGAFPNGRREINWDGGANTNISALVAGNNFNVNIARGAEFTTPGSGFLLSARIPGDNANPNLRFGDIDPSYAASFQVFSAQRLFIAQGSAVTDVRFFLPSSPTTPATVNGFGVVFADVDLAGVTHMEFYSASNSLLADVAAQPFNNGLSFIGASFDAGERIDHVRIFSGNTALGLGVLDGAHTDAVAMDDFIYGEPVPTPGAAALAIVGGVLSAARRRRV